MLEGNPGQKKRNLPEHFFVRLVGVSVIRHNPRPEVLVARDRPSLRCLGRSPTGRQRGRARCQTAFLSRAVAPRGAQEAQAAAKGEPEQERQGGPQRAEDRTQAHRGSYGQAELTGRPQDMAGAGHSGGSGPAGR